MSDAIDRLMEMRDRIDALMRGEEKRAEKLQAEIVGMEIKLALANALAALERAGPYVRHAGPQQQIRGAKEQIRKALAA